tara:strand:- start:134 stop:295 length:162 start_codon:yes stop_codon:yes gene_type:complete
MTAFENTDAGIERGLKIKSSAYSGLCFIKRTSGVCRLIPAREIMSAKQRDVTW